jgi:hypothetical protein
MGAVLLLGGVMWLAPGCVTRAEVGYGGYYDYDYYPDSDVYFYPEGRVYYWHDEGHWRSGRRLPPHFDLREAHHEHFRSHTRQPWTERRPGGEEHEEHEGHR